MWLFAILVFTSEHGVSLNSRIYGLIGGINQENDIRGTSTGMSEPGDRSGQLMMVVGEQEGDGV